MFNCTTVSCLNCPCSCSSRPYNRMDDLGAIIAYKPKITYNTSRTYSNGSKAPNGIEIRFENVRPTPEVREKLKSHGYKFSEKQTMWYAKDTSKARELANQLEIEAIEADDTQYEKRHFWAKVTSMAQYYALREYTEFFVNTQPPKNYYTKKSLEKSGAVANLIHADLLSFKKYYNKLVGEDTEDGGEEDGSEEDGGNDDGSREDGRKSTSSQKPTFKFKEGQNTAFIAVKLQIAAEEMQKQIDSKLNSAISKQRPTARRNRISSGMRQEGYKLQDIQTFLLALSEAYKNNAIDNYPYLKAIRTRSQAEMLINFSKSISERWSDSLIQSTFDRQESNFNKLGINSVFEASLACGQKDELIQAFNPSAIRVRNQVEEEIKEKEAELFGRKIPGFFPTPLNLIERLLSLSDIQDHHIILEPSAGKGDILDAIKKLRGSNINLFAAEINPSLREILKLKGYQNVGVDFLSIKAPFDRIIMNPPFENGQDVQHVMHAFSLLKHNGRVAAIVGEGAFFRQYKSDAAFRAFLMKQNAYVSEPIKDAFKNGFVSTGVNVRIVVINKDGSIPTFNHSTTEDKQEQKQKGIKYTHTFKNVPSEEQEEAIDELELQAQAELELLKMKILIAKKKKGLAGLNDPNKQKRLNYLRNKAQHLLGIPDVWNIN